MAVKFNPFTGQLQIDEKGSGGGGSAFFAGEVATYADLPLDGTAALNSRWLVRSNSGTWPFSSYKQAGVYVRVATAGSSRDNDYRLTDTSFHDVMSDSAFVLFDDGDATKNLKFQLSSIATGTTRTITVPDNDVTLPDQGTSTTDSPTFADLSVTGSFDAGAFATSGSVNIQSGALFVDSSATAVEFGVPFQFAAGAEADSRTNLGLGGAATLSVGTTTGTVAAGDDSRFHTRSHAITSTSDHTASNWSVFYSNGSGQVTELALGAANTVLTSNGASSAPSFAAASGGGSGGTKTYAVFTAEHNQPPSTAFATLDTRNSIAVLDFDDTAVESAVFVGVMPEAASLGSGLIVRLHWIPTNDVTTTRNVRWRVAFERSNTDLDLDGFAANTEANGAVPSATSGIPQMTSITVASGDLDGITAGDLFRLRVTRVGSDSTNDTCQNDAELVAVEVRSAA